MLLRFGVICFVEIVPTTLENAAPPHIQTYVRREVIQNEYNDTW